MELKFKVLAVISAVSFYSFHVQADNICADFFLETPLIVKVDQSSMDLTNKALRQEIEDAGKQINLADRSFPYVSMKTKDGSTKTLLIVGNDEKNVEFIDVTGHQDFEDRLAFIGNPLRNKSERQIKDLENLRNLENLIISNFGYVKRDKMLAFSTRWYGAVDSLVKHGLGLKKAIAENNKENRKINISMLWSDLFRLSYLTSEIANAQDLPSEELKKAKESFVSYLLFRLDGWNVDQGVSAEPVIYADNLNEFKHKALKFDKNEKPSSIQDQISLLIKKLTGADLK